MEDPTKLTPVWAYGGSIPGPTLRARRGETLHIQLQNNLPQPTSVHWHGIRLDNAMDGVVGLTRSVAQELGPAGIRVNAVCPGFINTPIFLGQLALEKDSTEALSTLRELASLAQPITRAGLPADIANAVAFLASDEASFITGQPLVVDGGMTLGAWQHPDLGDGVIAQALEAVTGKPAAEVDMVYHARSDS